MASKGAFKDALKYRFIIICVHVCMCMWTQVHMYVEAQGHFGCGVSELSILFNIYLLLVSLFSGRISFWPRARNRTRLAG